MGENHGIPLLLEREDILDQIDSECGHKIT
jgi:hypothetical protein